MLQRLHKRLNAAVGRGRRCWFWVAVALLLGAMGTAQVTSALQETQTWDEAIHIAAGYSYLKTGDYRLNREHPPLFKLLSAAALLPLDPALPLNSEAWRKADGVEFGDLFLYKNRVHPETMLFLARAVIIALTLALGLALALWTRRKFGPAAGIAALFLFAFDPNLIAHGHYVTSDLAATAFIFLAILAWERYLQTLRRRDLAVSGIVLGLALISKFSAVFLVPVLAVLYWLRRWQLGPGRLSLRRFAAASATVGVISIAVVALAYGPESIRCWSGPKLRQVVDRSTIPGEVLFQTGKRLGLPAHPYLAGLSDVVVHNKIGHDAYLMGMQSRKGWWYYFPVVFAVKTPLSVIALLALSIAIGLRPANPLKIPFHWIVLLLPPLVYFAFCMSSNINIGVRHLLPVYPFLYAAIAGAIAGAARRWRILSTALMLVLVIESLSIHPHYLAFFNAAAGGPDNGPNYLVDSNLDWGQDLKNLKNYLDRNGFDKVCICYFGRSSMEFYRFEYSDLPRTDEPERQAEADCIGAISVTSLRGIYVGENAYSWLLERKPIAKIGYSIYVYDLRKQALR
ncbi:MAG: ArnT family glycosyltransferase [Rhodospirillales bacterium]